MDKTYNNLPGIGMPLMFTDSSMVERVARPSDVVSSPFNISQKRVYPGGAIMTLSMRYFSKSCLTHAGS